MAMFYFLSALTSGKKHEKKKKQRLMWSDETERV